MTKSYNFLEDLPFITPDLPGIGGEIKDEPGHFVVEEIPLYEPSGQGDHIFVRLTREGWTTRRLARALAVLFELREVDVGYAGLKDKQALVTQTVSLYLPAVDEASAAGHIEEALPVRVLWARRHQRKLKTGHLLGNHFTILLKGPDREGPAWADDIAEALKSGGLPNYYGPQRFGIGGENIRRGREALEGRGPRRHWLRRFMLSAYQAFLFNAWLAERISVGLFDRLLNGDVAKKTDTGGLFEIEDSERERPRFEAGEITYTGPIYGGRMRWAGGQAGDLERNILERFKVTVDMLRRARLDGSRRPAKLFISDLTVRPDPVGLSFSFSLPKGAYATTVLREFIKADPPLPEE